MRKIKYLVVHSSATLQTESLSNIQAYWREHLKWERPGYHYIVYPDGKTVQLLNVEKICNGVAGYNHECIHVGYIGGIDSEGTTTDNRTAAQKIAILKLLRELKEQFPRAKIQGHRDFYPRQNDVWVSIKDCPCFNAIPEYSHL